MFRNTKSLESLIVQGLDTSQVENMSNMFRDTSSLVSLDLSSFDTSSVTTMSNMLNGMPSLRELTLGEEFAFVGTAHLLGLSQTAEFTGRWVNETGEFAFRSAQLMTQFNASTMSGTWVWERVTD